MKKFFLLLTVSIAFAACKPEIIPAPDTDFFNNPLQSQLDKDVHQFYQDYKLKMNAVSLSIGILENNTFHTYGYGETVLGNKTAPTENTFYEIGSVSKVFTALTAGIWLKQNNISLDAKIGSYLPSSIPLLQKNGTAVSFKNLLTHTSGLDRDPLEILLSKDLAAAYATFDSSKLYNYLKTAPLNSTPGSLYDYSNTGFGTMATILERQTHKSYEALIKEKITTVLAMNNTKVNLSPADELLAAKPYEGKILQPAIKFQAFNGAGALKSTTGDMLKFANAYINYTGSAELVNAMQACEKVQYAGNEAGGGQIETGLAWDYLPLAADNLYTLVHPGATFGHSSVLIINKKNKKALVMFITIPSTAAEQTAMQEFGNKLIIRALK
jgi:CubicO group peptidase (beta-lactamase class C family)